MSKARQREESAFSYGRELFINSEIDTGYSKFQNTVKKEALRLVNPKIRNIVNAGWRDAERGHISGKAKKREAMLERYQQARRMKK